MSSRLPTRRSWRLSSRRLSLRQQRRASQIRRSSCRLHCRPRRALVGCLGISSCTSNLSNANDNRRSPSLCRRRHRPTTSPITRSPLHGTCDRRRRERVVARMSTSSLLCRHLRRAQTLQSLPGESIVTASSSILSIQGFCCPLPQPNRPVCPVGECRSSSSDMSSVCRQRARDQSAARLWMCRVSVAMASLRSWMSSEDIETSGIVIMILSRHRRRYNNRRDNDHRRLADLLPPTMSFA